MKQKEFDPIRAKAAGYTKADWDAVDSPELTDEELAQMRPFAEVFPELAASIKRSRGRPKIDSPKQAITLRVTADTIARFKAKGSDWRAEMAKALEKAQP